MGRIRAHQPRLSGRRISSEVSAHIPCCQIQGTQAGNLKVREILAYAPPLPKYLFCGRPDGGHSRVEAEVSVDPLRQIQKALPQRSPASKRLERISCKVRPQRDAWRLKSELIGLKSFGAMILGQQSNGFLPGERRGRQCRHSALHEHFASRFHHQFRVRFLDSEKVENVSKIVHSLGYRYRGWQDVEFASCQPVARKRARLETRHVVSDRDRILVLVSGSMNNFVNHRPMVTGKVRAWLKYLLDKLFDQEGSDFSNPLRNRSS